MSEPVVIARLQKNQRETCRVALTEFRGTQLIDVRLTVPLGASAGVETPTAKGVSLNVALLPQLRQALQDAEARAQELGLIGGGHG